MNDRVGFDLSKIRATVAELPITDIRIVPFKEELLNRIIDNISLTDTMLLLSPLRLYLRIINSKKIRSHSVRTIESELYSFKRLVTYLGSINNLEERLNDRALLTSDYKKWLVGQEYSEINIETTYNNLIKIMKLGCGDMKNHDLKDELVLWLRYQKQIRSYEIEGQLTLEQLYPEFQINSNDMELLIGCKQVMLWLLNEFHNIRKYIKDSIPESLNSYYSELAANKEDPELLRYFYHYSYFDNIFSTDKVLLDFINSILSQKNIIANELMFVELIGFNKYYKDYVENNHIYTNTEILEYFSEMQIGHSNIPTSKCIGQLDYFKGVYQGSNHRLKKCERCMTNFPSLSFLISPSIDETLAMEWLLACDRVQTEGIKNLNLRDNVLLDKKKKSIQFINIIKNRSSDLQKTPVYHNDNNYNVHSAWIKLITDANKYIDGLNGKYIPNIPRASEKRRSQRDFHLLRKSFWLICTDNTYANKRILDDFDGSNAKNAVSSFIKLLRYHLLDVKKTSVLKAKINRDKTKKNIKSARRSKGDIGKLGIGVRSIAQTRAVIDDDLKFGRLVGHTKETHENSYRNKTKSKFVNTKSATWAADIGNRIINDAEKLFKNVEFVSVKEIKKVLDIYNRVDTEDLNEIKTIINKAESNGYVSELTTELNKLGKVYIMLTPWTAALIKAQIINISTEIESLELSHPEKRINIQTRQVYLGLLLERFPSKIIEEADQILEKYNIPFPRLV